MIKILIIDRDEKRLNNLFTVFTHSDSFYLLGVRDSIDNIENDLKALTPEITIVDTGLCDNLVYFKKELNSIKDLPATQFILSMDEEGPDDISNILKIGFEGFIHRDDKWEIIKESIHAVIKYGAFISPSIVKKFVKSTFFQENTKKKILLTPKEMEILLELADGNSFKMVAAKFELSYYTVSAHVRNIYSKMGVHSLSEALAFARKNSLLN